MSGKATSKKAAAAAIVAPADPPVGVAEGGVRKWKKRTIARRTVAKLGRQMRTNKLPARIAGNRLNGADSSRRQIMAALRAAGIDTITSIEEDAIPLLKQAAVLETLGFLRLSAQITRSEGILIPQERHGNLAICLLVERGRLPRSVRPVAPVAAAAHPDNEAASE